MNTQDKINKLKSELANAQREQDNCLHKWGKPYVESRESKKFEHHMVAHGSDIYPEVCGSHSVFKDVWCRKCIECGFVQETVRTEPVIVGTRPIFK